MLLREGDKRSDVYSLGRIINFIMTGNPMNSHHIFRSIAEKSTNSDASYRYADSSQLSTYFEKSIKFHENAKNEEDIFDKMKKGMFDGNVESYIYELSGNKVAEFLMDGKKGFFDTLLRFMNCDDSHAQHIIQSIDANYKDVCGRSLAAYDPFAGFAYRVLDGNYSFVVKETAATILRFVATDVNRFSAQRLVNELKEKGIEPLLEDILDS